MTDDRVLVERTINWVRIFVVVGLVPLIAFGSDEARAYRTLATVVAIAAAIYAVTMAAGRVRLRPLVSTALDLVFSLAIIATTGAGRSLGISLLFFVLAAAALRFPRVVAFRTAGCASVGAALVILLVPLPELATRARLESAIGWPASLLLASVLIGLLAELELREREALVLERERVAALAEQDRARRRVLRMVAHDLTAPLAAIQGVARSLGNPSINLAPGERAEALSLIVEQADHLRGFATSLQHVAGVSQTSRGAAVQRETISLGPWLESLGRSESFGPARIVELDVEPDGLPVIETDPGKLRRVLVNLIDNAVRHGNPGQPVRLVGAQVGEEVSLRVIDSGTGVRSDDLDAIFRPSWQGDDKVGESGLGLWIVAEFVGELGGTVTASNHESGGLDVEIRLPIARS